MIRPACDQCNANPPYKERGRWMTVRVWRPLRANGPAADTGTLLMCDKCVAPIFRTIYKAVLPKAKK